MNHNHRSITLEPYSMGNLLTEVVRSHLHQGMPSVMLQRVKDGVEKYRAEATADSEEQTLAAFLCRELETIISQWKKSEDSFYNSSDL